MAEHKIYYTVGEIPDGRILAIVTQGHPQANDKNVTVLHLAEVPTKAAGSALIEEWKRTKPWDRGKNGNNPRTT